MSCMKPFLLVTDLDNTLVGDDQALKDLNHVLSSHREQHGTKIVYSTGRSPKLYHRLTTEQTMLEPDLLVLSVGTEIFLAGQETPDPNWSNILAQNWDRDLVLAIGAHFADLTPQPSSEQRPFKVSYFLTEDAAIEVVPQFEALLTQQGLDAQLIYSGGQDLDVLPRQANKGRAMSFLREYLDIPAEATVACGDSGNDLSMFQDRSERGIIVGNAMPELLNWHRSNPNPNRYLAKAACAGGILEGLRHFQFVAA